IRDPYLHHAIVNAFDQLLEKERFPSYILFLEINPSSIDVNIHPTKTEIKFEDERIIYTLVKSAVRKALGSYVVIPEIDFADPNTFNPVPFPDSNQQVAAPPKISVNKHYNPFQDLGKQAPKNIQWHTIYENRYLETRDEASISTEVRTLTVGSTPSPAISEAFQLPEGKIAAYYNQKLIIVDQRAAHEKILFEKYVLYLQKHKAPIQQLLFPRTIEL